MSTATPPRRGHALVRSLAAPTVVTVAVAGAWWLAVTLDPSDALHEVALFVHLSCLTVGFGSVLSVDWTATLWLVGRRSFPDVLMAARNAHVLIWGGYAGLVASGVLLEPDPSDPLTALKLVLVLVIGLNGVVATTLQGRLERSGEAPSPGLLAGSALAGVLSQLSWWTATAIGFLNAR